MVTIWFYKVNIMRKNKMADPLFGHDGRCDFYGVNLVEIDKTKLPFN
ncbi:hypothetical protein [Aeromonas phage AS-szw]|uniref:Uncharacterized protein n=1 Tax=Aeromonas phage AS-szw TaxID=2026114 RepID=A0A291LE98_9CAUD|nr:hypothetical protein [Aeromonas phage AS-szw]